MIQPFSPGSIPRASGFPGEQLLLVEHLAVRSETANSLAFGVGVKMLLSSTAALRWQVFTQLHVGALHVWEGRV